MTGTDLYRDMAMFPEVEGSMNLADAIVVLQSAAMEMIPKSFHRKTVVIHQSVRPIKRPPLLKRSFLVSVIGHLRPEKDPFCIVRSLKYVSATSQLKVIHLGKAMSSEMSLQAQSMTKTSPRYRWLGEISHAKTLQWLARSHLMVISSIMEGGAHVVSEAIAIGVPVIASNIPGNRGLLGDDYPGYFPVGDEKSLSELLRKAEEDPIFYHSLCDAIQLRQQMIQPEIETQSVANLVAGVFKNQNVVD